jgi:hypothetical protein
VKRHVRSIGSELNVPRLCPYDYLPLRDRGQGWGGNLNAVFTCTRLGLATCSERTETRKYASLRTLFRHSGARGLSVNITGRRGRDSTAKWKETST